MTVPSHMSTVYSRLSHGIEKCPVSLMMPIGTPETKRMPARAILDVFRGKAEQEIEAGDIQALDVFLDD